MCMLHHSPVLIICTCFSSSHIDPALLFHVFILLLYDYETLILLFLVLLNHIGYLFFIISHRTFCTGVYVVLPIQLFPFTL